ncbi:PQQ-dependent sugar dehydrogenase [Rhodococcus sp. H36-A4]|uniref:PQQ-dependent sugar dehydrogenase n=1 Tax=Rhodococcus sp. H36-A4 TaxID=3004353 RepID=UPI0022AE589F|nr:PQQ-dependent sugar dehydrogenase [Rhodococcus sp. H36-A4]MCZ4079282.1 PQQ-dependent sugar dehydrogenase [Rhodococcus sp. H36-A4]
MTMTLACSSGSVAREDSVAPALDVTTELDGLSRPWDVVAAPDGAILTGERSGRFIVKRADGSVADLEADLGDLYAEGETGLMGIELAQDFSSSRTLYTCQGVLGEDAGMDSSGGAEGNRIAVVSWSVDAAWTELTRVATVLDGIPVAENGRHGGCRILAAEDGSLFVGTGDTASPTVPQDRTSLGGKVLHIEADGSPAADAPGRVYTLGHRNVQGLAFAPGTDTLYEVEQGTSRDDELNLVVPGGNYGYKPDREPGIYDESVEMTDPDRVPGARAAVWSSGSPTIATPALTFADGAAWGEWNGAAVLPSQQGRKLVFLKLTDDGTGVAQHAVALENEYGRLRSATSLPDGSILLTTDNGSEDKVLRIFPR